MDKLTLRMKSMNDLGICRLINVVEFKICCMRKLSQTILSFTDWYSLLRWLAVLPGIWRLCLGIWRLYLGICGLCQDIGKVGLGICGLLWLRPDWSRVLKTTAGLAAWDHWLWGRDRNLPWASPVWGSDGWRQIFQSYSSSNDLAIVVSLNIPFTHIAPR